MVIKTLGRWLLGLCAVLGCAHRSSTASGVWAEETSLREPRWMKWSPVWGVEGAVELSAGNEYTCARLRSGEVVCWGCQAASCDSATLIDLPPDVLEVASGPDYSCIRRAASVECWGGGELAEEERTPKAMKGVGVVDEMALGPTRACFRRHGTVWCTAASTANLALVRVPRLYDVVQVVAGADFFCALRVTGHVVCWGAGGRGQLGHGSQKDRATPGRVKGLRDAVQLTAGTSHACARLRDGTVQCWGDNRRGQLTAAAAGEWSTRPVRVPALSDATQITAFDATTYAVRSDGSVVGWGHGRRARLGGYDLVDPPARPVALVSRDVVEVAPQRKDVCVRLTSGSVACTGGTPRSTMVERSPATVGPVSGLDDAVEVVLGERHACARRSSGMVVCWGENDAGQLGDGTHETRDGPVPVLGLDGAVALGAGRHVSCAVRRDGAVVCWGNPWYGDDSSKSPRQHGRVPGGMAIAIDDWMHKCVLRDDGAVACWQHKNPEEEIPVVSGLADVAQIFVHGIHSCALKTGGAVMCWDWLDSEQRSGPLRAAPNLPADIEEVKWGPHFSCARTGRGTVSCWGQMWPPRRLAAATHAPLAIAGIRDAAEISVGTDHACARARSGEIWCWGKNYDAQLGDGTNIDRVVPTRVLGIEDAAEVDAGHDFTCVRRASGSVVCWGSYTAHRITGRPP